METILSRFPDLSGEIFNQLDDQSLVSAKEVDRRWWANILGQRNYWIRRILKQSRNFGYQNEWNMAVKKTPIQYL